MNYKSNYSEGFFRFENGKKMTDDIINEWIEDCIKQLERNKAGDHAGYSSGNTKVTVDRFYHNETSDEYYYAITVSKGYEEKYVYPEDEE